jgi:hypothetical protein
VYQAFLDLAAAGNAEAGEMIRPLRVIMPLYNEEIYFVVRSNSPLNFVHEIKDAKINVGPLRSGTAMSATTIYRQLFRRGPSRRECELPEQRGSAPQARQRFGPRRGRNGRRSAVQTPGDMKPEARKPSSCSKFDPANPASAAAFKDVLPVTIRLPAIPIFLPPTSRAPR